MKAGIRKAAGRLAGAVAGTLSTLGIFVCVVTACVMLTGKAIADPTDAATPYVGPRLIQEDVRIPAQGGKYSLAATILRPEGPGPYGAIVLNHGTPGSSTGRARSSATSPWSGSTRSPRRS